MFAKLKADPQFARLFEISMRRRNTPSESEKTLREIYRETKRYLRARGIRIRWNDKGWHEYYHINGGFLSRAEDEKLFRDLDNHHRRLRHDIDEFPDMFALAAAISGKMFGEEDEGSQLQ